MTHDSSNEFKAFKAVHDALEPLDEDARSRVVKSVATLLAIDAPLAAEQEEIEENQTVSNDNIQRSFSNLAELFGDTNPKTNSDKALVAGYWLQVEGGSDNFTSQVVNRELRNLGHKIDNITAAIAPLQNSKPQLIFQLKKSGSSQQARKTFQLSDAGVKRVVEMMKG